MTAPLQGLDLQSLKKFKDIAKEKGTSKLVIKASDISLPVNAISKAALQVVSKLQKNGFKAYLVGGCIRDLLLGYKPKDFDVSTNATPEQVRNVFRSNSRIIGRRFKIVHVIFGQDNIIEVTTFRSNAEPAPVKAAAYASKQNTRVSAESGMLLRDNVYGKSVVDDSLRRDFTINALYFDPVKGEIFDYNGGLYDLATRTIDIIGSPETRYSEDPVRMIRALRFAAKLGFKISERTSNPILDLKHNLLAVSNARMFEEVNKLFLTGHGLQSFGILKDYRIVELLFPGTADFLSNQNYLNFIEFALNSSDKRYQQGKRNMPHFLYSVMLFSVFNRSMFEMMQCARSMVTPMSSDDIIKATLESVFAQQDKVTAIPIAVTDNIRSLLRMQINLIDYSGNVEKAEKIYAKQIFRAAYDFFVLRSRFEPFLSQAVAFWAPYYDRSQVISEKRKKQREEERKRQRKNAKREWYATQFDDLIDNADPAISYEARAQIAKISEKASSSKKKKKDADAYERETSSERRAQLEKAKAWRKKMGLEI